MKERFQKAVAFLFPKEGEDIALEITRSNLNSIHRISFLVGIVEGILLLICVLEEAKENPFSFPLFQQCAILLSVFFCRVYHYAYLA